MSQICQQIEKAEAMWSKAEVDDFTQTQILKIYDINPSDAKFGLGIDGMSAMKNTPSRKPSDLHYRRHCLTWMPL